jgi:hypothetical protein
MTVLRILKRRNHVMVKLRKTFPSIMILLSCLTLAVYPVYAWFTINNQPSVAEFRAGEVKAQTTLANATLSGGITLENLTYVDFSNDIVADATGMLNTIATGIVLDIEALEGTVPIRNEIELIFPEGQDELLYLIIWEGLNLEESHINVTDYHSYLMGLVGEGVTDELTWREAIDLHNASMLSDLSTLSMSESDTVRIQIVFWGDYDHLSNPSTFLDINYTFQLKVQSVQVEKE